MTDLRRGLYLHVPWCRRRCPYCDFYFEVGRAEAHFAEAVDQELRARADEVTAPFDTLYLGGGTPSALPPAGFSALWEVLARHVDLSFAAEVTVEANPEDVDEALLDCWQGLGVTRVSLGVQSFDADTLRALGRGHDPGQAVTATAACAARFRTSVDVITGVPGDEPGRAPGDVAHALDAGAEHISAYMLTVEPGTPWEKRAQQDASLRPDDDVQADAYEAVRDAASSGGLLQYEVSSFARPGAQSVHNRIYWSQGTYVGLGPSAHSLRLLPDGGAERRHNVASWAAYQKDPGPKTERLLPDDAFLEAVAFGLRDVEHGVSVADLAARHRATVHREVEAAVDEMCRGPSPHLVREHHRVRLTPSGVLFADAVARTLLGVEPA